MILPLKLSLCCCCLFASYLIAEHIGFSGILAAVAAGMTISKSGVIRNAPLAMRLRADSVWSMLEFVFNGLVFIMLGLQLPVIWTSSVIQADLDPEVEVWMLFARRLCYLFCVTDFTFYMVMANEENQPSLYEKTSP
ncbi:Na(+)/H(+) exchanger [Proteus mirabilis]|uniref:Na(+)/H(+) exchanger n=1 Tax=Proteus mirabilis TaxID=584 RepID=A0A2X2DL78_PROMI|nr:Na(+)/H(+) exchanger [Proteus mirabilis]